MKRIFFIGIILLLVFEATKVYFIMPMPGSQQIPSLKLAYFLHSYQWVFRLLFCGMVLIGFESVFRVNRLLAVFCVLMVGVGAYVFNFLMAADTMFYQPQNLMMKNAKANKIPLERIVIGLSINGQAKAYPISLMAYHHQVRDTLGGKSIMVTYCSVCRTGRVFEPIVNGKSETFRLVGMDYFNAMFEDQSTKSWWRQTNGEAIIGKLKGTKLPEFPSQQASLQTWLKLYPDSKIMQADPQYRTSYDSTAKYESGKSKKELTGTDSMSWKRKSWVVGIAIGKASKAFDWNRLKKERIISTEIGSKKIVLALASDNKSFFAFEQALGEGLIQLQKDTLVIGTLKYDLKGNGINHKASLKKINAYQEFWHSWQTFHATTERY